MFSNATRDVCSLNDMVSSMTSFQSQKEAKVKEVKKIKGDRHRLDSSMNLDLSVEDHPQAESGEP